MWHLKNGIWQSKRKLFADKIETIQIPKFDLQLFAEAVPFSIDGEDAGSTPWEFDSVSGTFALDATAKNHGDYGYKLSASSSGYGHVDLSATETDLYVRAYVYLSPSFANTSAWTKGWLIWICDGTTDGARVGVYCGSGGVGSEWAFYGDGGVDTTSATNYSAGAWHCIEVRYLKHASAGGMQVWIDETLVLDDINQATTTNANDVEIGTKWGGTIATGHYVYFDDIECDTSYIGPYSEAPSDLSISISDTISLTETIGPLQNLGPVSISDTITLAELIKGLLSIRPSVTDTFTLAELVSLIYSLEPRLSDSLTFNEVITARLSNLGVEVTDTMSLTELVTAAMSSLEIDISDSITFAEAVTVTVSALADLTIDISDAVTITEVITAKMSDLEIDISDTLSLAEAVTVILETLGDLTISISDTLSLVESIISRMSIGDIDISDSISLAEAVTVVVGAAFGWVSLDGISFYAS